VHRRTDDEPASLKARALSGLRWSASARVASQLIAWAITLVVIRILTPGDYGLLAMASVFIAFSSLFSELGLGAAVVQGREVNEAMLRKTFALVIAMHFALAALLVLGAPLIAAFYGEPRVTAVVRVLAMQFVVGAFAVIPDALLQRRMAFRERSLVELSSTIVSGVTTLSLAVLGAGVWALVAGAIATQVWRTAALHYFEPFLRRPQLSVAGMQSMLRFGGHLTVAGVCWMCYAQADLLVCGKWLGHEMLGFYSVALHIASQPVQRLTLLVNQVAFPVFSVMQRDPARLRANAIAGVRMMSFFAFPVMWGTSSIAPELVETVLGERWLPAVLPLGIFALVIPLRMVGNFMQTAVQGAGRTDVVLNNAIWALLIAPPLFIAGVSWHGLLGLSAAWLIASPAVFAQGAYRAAHALGVGFRDVINALLPPACASAVMYAGLAAGRELLRAQGYGPLARLAALIALGAALYGLASLSFNRRGAREVLDMAKNVASTRRPMAIGT
jgi:O-antigen/teichoic acid export membrane protein